MYVETGYEDQYGETGYEDQYGETGYEDRYGEDEYSPSQEDYEYEPEAFTWDAERSLRVTTDCTARMGPGTNYEAVGSISAGTVLTGIGESGDGGWYLVYYDGDIRWISASCAAPAASDSGKSSDRDSHVDESYEDEEKSYEDVDDEYDYDDGYYDEYDADYSDGYDDDYSTYEDADWN